MKTREKILILFHFIIITILGFFYFGKLWIFLINILPFIYIFIGEKEDV